MSKTRLLIVDDSVFMRTTLTKILTTPDIEIVGTAKNGKEGVELARKLNPDVITMDIEMPIMTGIEALQEIMSSNPIPVIMISSLTSEGADATIEALSLGAVDFVTKKQAFNEMFSMKEELIGKILAMRNNPLLDNKMHRRNKNEPLEGKSIALNITERLAARQNEKKIQSVVGNRKRPQAKDIEIIGIGISTGGPVALQSLMKRLPGNLPVPILISQHMPPYFTKTLSQRLNSLSQLEVVEASDGDVLLPGKVFVAPGGYHITVSKKMLIQVSQEPKNEIFKPSVNVMMTSIAEIFGPKSVGIIMTGMGNDGMLGLRKLHEKGGYVISQDIESCVVAGMPKSVIENGIADEIQSLQDMPLAIASLFNLNAI